jgi:uncharacterized protein (DUF488 family)
MTESLFTIGHSNHTITDFINLLKSHEISVLCDVRSNPYSKYCPQFNRESLINELKKNKIKYVFLGKELGPRSENSDHYINGIVQYNKLENNQKFKNAVDRIIRGIEFYRIALMCAEKDPLYCHRMILICKNIREKEVDILHILEDGSYEKNADAEMRLVKTLKVKHESLFETMDETILRAYRIQSRKIAYVNDKK